MTSARVTLPDGRVVECAVRRHPRYRNLRLSLRASGRLSVSAPSRLRDAAIRSYLQEHAGWIMQRLPVADVARPVTLELRALGEAWCLSYGSGSGRLAAVAGILHLPGSDLDQAGVAALRRWLAARARAGLVPALDRLSLATGLEYRRVSIRGQVSRWGSCSAGRDISLNWKLLFLPPELVHYVLLHELCHLRHMNHSTAYWRLVASFEPEMASLRGRMRKAGEFVPAWLDSH